MQIIPAILEKDFSQVRKKIELCQGVFDLVQIDICDGVLVRNITWQNAKDLEKLSMSVDLEIHLMVSDPIEVIPQWSHKLVKRIIFHIEAESNPFDTLALIKKIKKEAGIAINPSTPLAKLEGFVPELCSEVLFLGVEPGSQGQGFQVSVLGKIKQFRKSFPGIKIGVDGGVNLLVAPQLIEAGIDYLVVGSYFWKNLSGYPREEQKVRIKKLSRAIKFSQKSSKFKNFFCRPLK